MEPQKALEILAPLISSAPLIAEKSEATEQQITDINEAIDTITLAVALAQKLWDSNFPLWLQHCRDQLIQTAGNRAERRRLEVVK